jgi:uncharacterized protein (UPF0332 family)
VNHLIYETYLRNARESLKVANQLFQNKTSSLWVVVSSYYAMFYMASAYLYKLGYKSGNEAVHHVVNEALIVKGRHKLKSHILENYNEEREKALTIVDTYLDNYEREKRKRATFQYETTEDIKESKAQTSLTRAKEFLTLMEEIL